MAYSVPACALCAEKSALLVALAVWVKVTDGRAAMLTLSLRNFFQAAKARSLAALPSP